MTWNRCSASNEQKYAIKNTTSDTLWFTSSLALHSRFLNTHHLAMDPLSISVSVVALIGAVGSALGGIRKLSTLIGAPDELLWAMNEVVRLLKRREEYY